MYIDRLINELRRQVCEYKYVDVGVGSEDIYCVSRERLRFALKKLESDGYSITTIYLNDNPYEQPYYRTQILSRDPISEKEIDDHREEWACIRNDIMMVKITNNVFKNMILYHLNDFNPLYYYKDDKVRTMRHIDKNNELVFCSKLINVMNKNGATSEEVSDVIKYSLVILDAEKKHLNWKQASKDLKIKEMTKKYYPSYKTRNKQG